MAVLSDYARRKKLGYFFSSIPKDARILEIGCGSGWLGRKLAGQGFTRYTGMDVQPPADVVGDIRDWHSLGLNPASFDLIIAFEVVEHVHCFQEMYDLLVPGGQLALTSPHPNWDWLCQLLERLGLNQPRTSPHDHLIDFHRIPLFEVVNIRRVGLMAQWGIFRKPA